MTVKSVVALAGIVLGACGTAVPSSAPTSPAIVGVIQGVPPDLGKPRIDALRAGLDALGYREGREFTFELRYLEGQGMDRAQELAVELVGRGAAVIVTGNPAGVEGARRATSTVPIVMAGVGTDPVGDGWVASLARPGGNVTGISLQVPTIAGRRLQLLKDLLPSSTTIGVLHDPTSAANVLRELEQAATSLGIRLHTIAAKDAAEIDAAFGTFRSAGIGAVHVNVSAVFAPNFARIAAAASSQRIATSFGLPDGVRAGGLLALGPEQADLYRRAGGFVSKILKGAKPSELPVEQPEKFDLIVNLRTAQVVGITVPASILAQATEVIR